jgi:hypothetical protein
MQRLSEDQLIAELRLRLNPGMRPPLGEAALQEAEMWLGFELPPLVRRLYGEVGNGEFGPRLLPLALPNEGYRGETIAYWYRALRDNPPTEDDFDPEVDVQLPPAEWPERLLTICDWGCNIYSCIDCSQAEMPVLRNDNNVSWTILAHEAPSLHEWLERWLQGEKLFYLDWHAARKTQLPPWQPPNGTSKTETDPSA